MERMSEVARLGGKSEAVGDRQWGGDDSDVDSVGSVKVDVDDVDGKREESCGRERVN